MKKLAFCMAMILCLIPMLCACGANSSAEKAAEAAFVAENVNFDYEAYFKVAYRYNTNLVAKAYDSDEDRQAAKETTRELKDSKKELLKSAKDYIKDADIKKWKIEYDVRFCKEYSKDDDMFDEIIESKFDYEDTDLEDDITKVAIVGIAYEAYITDEDGNKTVSGDYETYYCFKIDGDWYID